MSKVTGFYVCGTGSTIADMADGREPSELINVIEFDSIELKNMFEEGLEFADGWEEVNDFDTHEKALAYVTEAVGQYGEEDDDLEGLEEEEDEDEE